MSGFNLVLLFCFLLSTSAISLKNEGTKDETALYFPPVETNEWATTSPQELNWDTTALNDLVKFVFDNKTRAFIILKDGKIVVEAYGGKKISKRGDFDENSLWYWASAGKTVTSFLVGIAQEKGFLDIENPTSDYLGKGWTNLPSAQEEEITVKHQLTMTTGLDYTVKDKNCTIPECLTFKENAGDQWYYHNAPYTLLEKVVSNATGENYNAFTNHQLEEKIGLKGRWIKHNSNNVYWSTARDAARFGLLILNKGRWENEVIMQDTAYFNAMVNTSQVLNKSYGYLWWLNGKESVIYPTVSRSRATSLAPDAPKDLIAALGKNGQIIDVVPSENIVLIRMGESPGDLFVPTAFHNEIWKRMRSVLNN